MRRNKLGLLMGDMWKWVKQKSGTNACFVEKGESHVEVDHLAKKWKQAVVKMAFEKERVTKNLIATVHETKYSHKNSGDSAPWALPG